MNCARMRQVMDAWIDGELDAATASEIEQHLAQCPGCLALKGERDALRREVHANAPRFEAPPALRTAILARIDQTAMPAAAAPRNRRHSRCCSRRQLCPTRPGYQGRPAAHR